MNKLKSREMSYGILMIFGSILVLMAILQTPDDQPGIR